MDFDTEFIELLKHEDLSADYTERWAFIEKINRYFYQNHSFYRKALQIKGQNSFSDHFREYIRPLIAVRISKLFGEQQWDEFTLDFLSDAVVCAMERWLRTKGMLCRRAVCGKAEGAHRKVRTCYLPGDVSDGTRALLIFPPAERVVT